MPRKQAFTGISLIAGGVLALLVNGVLTPMLPTEAPFPEVAASHLFFIRLSMATVVALCLIIGTTGLHLRQSERVGWFGRSTYCLAFLGNLFLFAHEWSQIFFVHALANVSPSALNSLENIEGQNLFDLEFILSASTFTLGWILFSVSLCVGKEFRKAGPLLVIGGIFLIPILSGIIAPIAGMILGNLVLSAGWIVLGYELISPTVLKQTNK